MTECRADVNKLECGSSRRKVGQVICAKKVQNLFSKLFFAPTLLHLLTLADAEPRDNADVPLETTWRGFTKLQKRGSHFGRAPGDIFCLLATDL